MCPTQHYISTSMDNAHEQRARANCALKMSRSGSTARSNWSSSIVHPNNAKWSPSEAKHSKFDKPYKHWWSKHAKEQVAVTEPLGRCTEVHYVNTIDGGLNLAGHIIACRFRSVSLVCWSEMAMWPRQVASNDLCTFCLTESDLQRFLLAMAQ